ncbi:hypothetical protein [Povalibacter sp.]|mgnify:CR=1 FL=1|uniref:hypothetical protein n=1 Tax=Povalibacter sp. TaxID=1962978 RepID=UPI002D1FB287|nr:hypothetical protein [Povalibacter sp.]
MSRGFTVPSAANSWSMHDVQKLQSLVEARTSLREIAKILRRTESSIRNKAALHGISLRGLLCEPRSA